MLWYLLAGAACTLALLSSLLPTWRRVWAFHLTAFKYLGLWLADVTRVRRLVLRASGRPCFPLTRPVLLRLFCEDMGPTFIKFGQIVASSAGMFPERYTAEFQKCLDRVRPFGFDDVERILADELGDRARDLADVEPRPLASASIAQFHAATLDDREVVVKVQRPGVAARVAADMRIMRAAARVVARFVRDAELANPVGVVDDFAATLREELDFCLEAKNLDRFNEIMSELGYADVRAPVPRWDYTTRRVLVMERFRGTRVDHAEAILARGVDAEGMLVKGLRAWFQCVIFHGFFHGDVHAGNLMLLDDGDLGFLDFGIVGRFSARQRQMVTDYMIAFVTGDYRRLAEVIVEMGGVPDGLDMDAFVADLDVTYAPLRQLAFGDINYADFLPAINRVASRHRMRMPAEFVLITKQLLYFDRYAKLLAPRLNIFTDPRLLISLMGDIQKARAAAAATTAGGSPQ